MDASVLTLYLKTCTQAWIGLYLFFCLLMSLPVFMIHVAVVGGLLCGLSFLRLPPSDPIDTFRLLGSDPRDLDGTSVNRKRSFMGIIGRRCAGLDAPENTLSAVKQAKAHDAKFVHFEVIFTFDGIAVVTSRADVATKTFNETKQIDAAEGHVLCEKYSPEKIPTVDEMIEECLAAELHMIIQVGEHFGAADKVSNFVLELYKKEPRLYENAIILSCWPHILYMIRSHDTRIISALSWHPSRLSLQTFSTQTNELLPHQKSATFVTKIGDWILSWAVHEFLWYFLGIAAIFVPKDQLSPSYVQKWRERGIRQIAHTVNSSIERAYIERVLGVSCMSDTLDELPIEYVLRDE